MLGEAPEKGEPEQNLMVGDGSIHAGVGMLVWVKAKAVP